MVETQPLDVSEDVLSDVAQRLNDLPLPPSVRCFRFKLIEEVCDHPDDPRFEWAFDPTTKQSLGLSDPRCLSRSRRAFDGSFLWLKNTVLDEYPP
jgi:hypothetical protein